MLNGVFMGKWWVLYALAPHWRPVVARSANGHAVRDRVYHVPLGGEVALALAMASMVVLNLSRNEIYRIIPTARKAELQTAINEVRSTLLDNATLEMRAHVFFAIANALRKGLSLGHAAGALAVALSFSMEREKIALKAPPKQGETGGKCNNGNENGKE